jgi:Bacterial regulatory proteins, lacI family
MTVLRSHESDSVAEAGCRVGGEQQSCEQAHLRRWIAFASRGACLRASPAVTGANPCLIGSRHPKIVTIRDIAEHTGVSIGTESKALNGKGKLRAETRKAEMSPASPKEASPAGDQHSGVC